MKQKKSRSMSTNRLVKRIFDAMWILGELVAMQFYFLAFSFKGGLVLGIFPSLACVFKVYFKWFSDWGESYKLSKVFSDTWKETFKRSNQIGYSLLLVFGFLYFDIRVNRDMIQSQLLHIILLIIMGIISFLTIYTFTILIGYTLTYKEIFKQSLFVSFATPVHTIAAVVGTIAVSYILWLVIPFFILFGVPALILPIAWFTYSGLEKIEILKEKYQNAEQ